jgi:hypothetical protein
MDAVAAGTAQRSRTQSQIIFIRAACICSIGRRLLFHRADYYLFRSTLIKLRLYTLKRGIYYRRSNAFIATNDLRLSAIKKQAQENAVKAHRRAL